MTSHPNRGRDPYRAGRRPRPREIKALRESADLTQRELAAVMHKSERWVQSAEAGAHRMQASDWLLMQLKAAVLAEDRGELTRAVRRLREDVRSALS